MALPSRDKTFAFSVCRDLLDKLKREVGRYKVAYAANDLELMKDLAFNISITGWQLCEWVFADMTAEQRSALKITGKRRCRTMPAGSVPQYECSPNGDRLQTLGRIALPRPRGRRCGDGECDLACR